MRKIIIIFMALIMMILLPFQCMTAENITLPDSVEELLSLNTSIIQKLCNTSKNVYQFSLGEYHCPEDIVPGSYIIYIFGNDSSLYSTTTLRYVDSYGYTTDISVGKLDVASYKIKMSEGDAFLLSEATIGNHFGVKCFIAPWTRIGE